MPTATYDPTRAQERLDEIRNNGGEIPTPTHEVQRTYMVALVPPHGTDGEPYEERPVRLRYTVDAADVLHPLSGEAKAEALRRALRLEAKEFESGDVAKAYKAGQNPAEVFDGHVRYIGGTLVDYLPRSRPRPRPRSSR